jgi:hypothetical protein
LYHPRIDQYLNGDYKCLHDHLVKEIGDNKLQSPKICLI